MSQYPSLETNDVIFVNQWNCKVNHTSEKTVVLRKEVHSEFLKPNRQIYVFNCLFGRLLYFRAKRQSLHFKSVTPFPWDILITSLQRDNNQISNHKQNALSAQINVLRDSLWPWRNKWSVSFWKIYKLLPFCK